MDEPAREVFLICAICNGPVYSGEPVITHDVVVATDGSWIISYAHRFYTTCNYFRELDNKFVKDLGIDLT